MDLKFRPHASAHAPALLSTDRTTGRPTLIGGVSILSFNRAISLSSPLPSADGRLITVQLNYLREQFRLIAIYAPTQFYERRMWWTTTLVPALEAPTAAAASMLVGDFNSVVLPIDRNRPPKDFEVLFPSTPSPDSWDRWKLDLTLNLKRFSNQERRRVDGTIAHLEQTIGSLQRHAAYTPLTQAESNRLDQARLHLAKYEAAKASEIALKAKLKVEGHKEMGVSSLLSGSNQRLKGSIISSLTLPNGQTTSELPTMTNIAPLSLVEIGKALLSLSRGKTPGPDGLPGELFRQFSPRFAPAFHSLLSPLQPLSRLPPSMLTGRTVLIPKRGDSSLVENLRPITCMNADYKVLALCLANRLQLVLPQVIHPSQTAFIKNRKIGDTINDTLDIMDWAAFSSAPLLALTVDFRKAYDLVDRPFLLQALAVLGLPASFIHWVRLTHSDTSTRISVNNMLGPTFPVRTGVRQGCPLAPLLFVCVIEIFHRYMTLFLPGFALSPAQRRLMACYADDVTLFLNSDTELGLAVLLLGVFGSVSGEVPNWNKCSIIPINIPPTDLVHTGPIPVRAPDEAERILGIYVERLHPGSTTWTMALARIQNTAKFLAVLHATVTCRKSLSSIFLNSVISYPGRFQPAPPDTIKRLDISVGNFLSSSKHKQDGLAQRFLPNGLLYNSPRDGGVGAIAPSTQVKALAIQRALRRFGPTPSEEVARTLTPFPYGLHGLLSHKAILERGYLPTFIPPRALDELKAILFVPLVIHAPPLRMQCILTEPLAINRSLLKPDNRPFGTRQHERFLLIRQLRVGHIVRVTNLGVNPISTQEFCSQLPEEFHDDATSILPVLIKAIKRPWWAALRTPHASSASPGDWFMLSNDHYSISHLVVQVVAYIPPSSVSATVHLV
ncbi:unnamed protein product [Closterium sp. Yama58-4]|nr:unnamed protein product [Closterium sp. Yama58-4]